MTLTRPEMDSFLRDGFVVVRGAIDRPTVDGCRAELWDAITEDPCEPATWTEPVRRVDSPMTPVFAVFAGAPALREAYDQLVGPGRWRPRTELGNVAIRFPAPGDSNDTGWHIDASYLPNGAARYHVNVRSRDRGLLMLFLLSDVTADDAPTRIRVGSHLMVPRLLAPYGDAGVDMFDLADEFDEIGNCDCADRPEVAATGSAGDVFLCHPFLVHAAQRHHGVNPRFMSQPGLGLAVDLDLRNPRHPVEAAITAAL